MFFFSFIFISWRLITLQYCSGFCQTLRDMTCGKYLPMLLQNFKRFVGKKNLQLFKKITIIFPFFFFWMKTTKEYGDTSDFFIRSLIPLYITHV